jgi:hypothetical protein
MTTYTVTETTVGADQVPVVVTRTYTWDEGTEDLLNAAAVASFLRIPDALLDQVVAKNLEALIRAQIDTVTEKQAESWDRAVDTVRAAKPPRYLTPGDNQKAFDANDCILSITADGAVFKDGVRLGTSMVQKLCVYGNTVLAKGKTDGLTWKWDGTKWTQVTVDSTVIAW